MQEYFNVFQKHCFETDVAKSLHPTSLRYECVHFNVNYMIEKFNTTPLSIRSMRER